MNNDRLQELLEKMIAFYRARDWEQFHSPKNLAMNLASEVGELVQPLRWLTEHQSRELDEETMKEMRDEIGDVCICLIYLAHELRIDPIEAAYQTLIKMGKKFPAPLCRETNCKSTAHSSDDRNAESVNAPLASDDCRG